MERPLFVPASSAVCPTLSHVYSCLLFTIGPDDGVDPQCSDKLVPDAFEGNRDDHTGPYNGILIGTEACTP
jgi:hypothetical protein